MKKAIIFILFVVGALHAYAQNVDSLQVQTQPITIDSLSLRFSKLQHDYDFLYCDYELHKLMADLSDLSNSINISSNSVIIDYYNGRYDRALYASITNKYDAYCTYWDTLKDRIVAVRLAVLVKMTKSDFSETEKDIISASFDAIKSSVTTVEAALDYYDAAIRAYKGKR